MNRPPPLGTARERLASEAFAAHTAMLKAEVADPRLRANEAWKALRDTAFARYRAAFEALL